VTGQATQQRRRPFRQLAAIAVVAVIVGAPASAGADAYLRVIAQRAPVHTGPDAHYRTVYNAERGDVFPVLERGTRGYWFRIELEDGTTGWVYGELVSPFEVVGNHKPDVLVRAWHAVRRTLFGPSPVGYSNVSIAVSAGSLGNEGIYLLRPSWLVDPYWAIEGFFGLGPHLAEDLFLGGAGFTLRFDPGAAIRPYLNVGAGVAWLRPKADNFLDQQHALMALAAGGGLEMTFKKQITLRFDFRNWILFDADQGSSAQEYSGGLAVFF